MYSRWNLSFLHAEQIE